MTFKTRMLEESFDKLKNFVKNNAGAVAAGTGIGAGLLYNYLTGGADTELASNQAVMNKFLTTDVPAAVQTDKYVDPDKFFEYVKNIQDKNTDSFWGDHMPFTTSNEEAIQKIHELEKSDPRFSGESVGGYKINPSTAPDKQYELYKKFVDEHVIKKSPDDVIKSNSELAEKKADLQNAIEHSTRNSYLKKATLGGVLAAGLHQGGKFAKRKLNDRI